MGTTLSAAQDGAAQIVTRDPFDQLDQALAGQRLLSKAILAATERGDARAIEALSDLRAELSNEVDELLKITDRMVTSHE